MVTKFGLSRQLYLYIDRCGGKDDVMMHLETCALFDLVSVVKGESVDVCGDLWQHVGVS